MIAQQSEMRLYVALAQHVARGRQIGEREDPGRRDPDRQDARAGREALRLGGGGCGGGAPPAPAVPRSCQPSRDSHEQHRPRERRAHLERPRRSVRAGATNARLEKWLTWPGVLPSSRRYAPRAMFSPRHSGSRGTDTSRWRPRDARHLGDASRAGSGTCSSTSIAATRSNSPSRERERQWSPATGANSRFGRSRVAHSACELRILEVDPDDAAVAELLGPPVGEHALAAADVEHRARRGAARTAPRASARTPPSAAGRPGWSSRTCRTCCRSEPPPARPRRTSYPEGLAHTSVSARSPGRSGPLRAPGGRPARSATARPRAGARSADPLERPLRERPLGGEQVADHAERAEQHRGDEQHRAEDQRLRVAGAARGWR